MNIMYLIGWFGWQWKAAGWFMEIVDQCEYSCTHGQTIFTDRHFFRSYETILQTQKFLITGKKTKKH